MKRGGRFLGVALTGAMALLGAGGCDLLEFAKNPAITFNLPEQRFVIRTQDWKQPPPTFANPISCATATDCCKVPGLPAGAPQPFDCQQYSLTCDEGVCGMRFPVEVFKKVDLSMDVPTLAQMKGKVVSDIVLTGLQYTVNNQLMAALPPTTVYVAPGQVTSAMGNAEAKQLTVVPMIPGSAVRTDAAPLNEEGQRAFSGFAREFQTPFNFIASTTFVMRSGSPPPVASEIQVAFTGTVTAKF